MRVEDTHVVRDISVLCADEEHGERVVDAIRAIDGIRVASVSDRTFLLHKGGKIEIDTAVRTLAPADDGCRQDLGRGRPGDAEAQASTTEISSGSAERAHNGRRNLYGG